jgi:prepilin-type N-terminal cleavage/methylation domain-containing protein
MSNKSNKAFTLIELLTVIAIIGILAAILIPTVGAARTSALKAKTKVQFSQWAVALQLFKTEYGYFPAINTNTKINSPAFFGAMTGKNYLGVAQTGTALYGNTKKLSFYSASDSEVSLIANGDLADGLLKDAFGNTDIAVFYDSNGDGKISVSDSPALSSASVTPVGGTAISPATGKIDTSSTGGIRAGVIFYSAGKGSTSTDIVYSWQ